ncbi:small multi-drug export protein [Clostridium sp. AF32-12BH]|uniref:COG2426 family protein n=1 Tax=Clostridium sp. AF32-12BH TaxID=2292006 RepID=UPI000E4E5933|nr:small multi-drug export protein [Clostridium sp. AF32-12BH]RHP48489.1 small multi-drug export protein [Clostridium sp. AF32-12BH]
MTDTLVQGLASLLGGKVSGEAIIFIISMIPILELRGGLLAASPALLNVPILKAIPICIIGNLLPIPFILLLIEKVLNGMERVPGLSKVAIWVRQKADKNKGQIEKFGFWGLVLFVGIPLPGTGAWTGSLVAALLHMKFGKAIGAILCGIIMATVIMSLLSYGLLGALFA